MTGNAKVELCRLYENTSQAGKTYFVGYLGKAKVLMLKDEKAAEGQPPWVLFLCERPDKRADAGQQPARDTGARLTCTTAVEAP